MKNTRLSYRKAELLDELDKHKEFVDMFRNMEKNGEIELEKLNLWEEASSRALLKGIILGLISGASLVLFIVLTILTAIFA